MQKLKMSRGTLLTFEEGYEESSEPKPAALRVYRILIFGDQKRIYGILLFFVTDKTNSTDRKITSHALQKINIIVFYTALQCHSRISNHFIGTIFV